MKRFLRYSGQKRSYEYHQGVPAVINDRFFMRQVEAAFISSIHAKRHQGAKLGIIAKKEVQSVLLLPHRPQRLDSDSATSNALAKILKLQGTILIGDKALRHALAHTDYIDLAAHWHAKTRLPFVFALLCFHKEGVFREKLERRFLKEQSGIKIPYYLLQKASKATQIAPSDILSYLKLIDYRVDDKSRKSLRLFYKKLRLSR